MSYNSPMDIWPLVGVGVGVALRPYLLKGIHKALLPLDRAIRSMPEGRVKRLLLLDVGDRDRRPTDR